MACVTHPTTEVHIPPTKQGALCDESYNLKSIIDHALNEQEEMTYNVRWKGHDATDDTYLTYREFSSLSLRYPSLFPALAFP
jgi:hypothetical protein